METVAIRALKDRKDIRVVQEIRVLMETVAA
jgi:hypothetical protein